MSTDQDTSNTEDLTHQIAARLGKIVVPNEEAERRRERYTRITTEANAGALWDRSGVPKRHAMLAFQAHSPHQDHPWSQTQAKVFGAIGRGVTVCLTGVGGTGKTQIGVDAIRKVTDEGKSGLFTTASGMFGAIRAANLPGSSKSEMEIVNRFRRPALLVIDEVGQRSESAWENRIFFEILNSRYGDMSDTIMTCNLGLEELSQSLGPSILDRMREGGGIIDCQWQSFRK